MTRKWTRELDYRLIKEVWAFRENRIAVRFAYEWHDDSNQWFRSYGNENWEFDAEGLMRLRIASINDLPIKESEQIPLAVRSSAGWPPFSERSGALVGSDYRGWRIRRLTPAIRCAVLAISGDERDTERGSFD